MAVIVIHTNFGKFICSNSFIFVDLFKISYKKLNYVDFCFLPIQIFQSDATKLSSDELPKCLQQTFCLIAAKGTKEIDKLLDTYRGIQKICENFPSPRSKSFTSLMADLRQDINTKQSFFI